MRFLAGLLLTSALMAAEPQLQVSCETLLRPGIPQRITVHCTDLRGPGTVIATVVDGLTLLTRSAVPLNDLGDLAGGLRLAVTSEATIAAPTLRVRIEDRSGTILAERSMPLTTLGRSFQSARVCAEALGPAAQEPLPALWLSTLAEIAEPGTTPTLFQAATVEPLVRALQGWPATPAGDVAAFIDPVDGSAQPVRLLLPARPGAPLALLVRRGPFLRSTWSRVPDAWLEAARAAGVAVAEVHPGGAASGRGVVARRLDLAEAAVRQRWPDLGPRRCAATHDRTGDPSHTGFWTSDHPLPASTSGPLTRWADGPFVVVLGTAEHAAAVEDNRRLALAFRRAWEAHALGFPPVVEDRAFDAGRYAGHHLVLIGNPRSNRVAAGLSLPVTWDDRSVTHGSVVLERCRGPRIAIALPKPQDPRLSILLLDGTPAWDEAVGELPLISEPVGDVVVR